jgi:hypothetical protein
MAVPAKHTPWPDAASATHSGALTISARSESAAGAQTSVRRFTHSYTWIVLGLVLMAVLSRVYTTNSLAGEPTSDEYLYAVHARDLARDWSAGQIVSLADLGVEGRSVAVEAAALSMLLPWDPLTIGRTAQALLNALCVPMTFVLARQIGLTRSAAVAGALLLMAVPQFQELAWRFWTDSQATLLVLIYLSALVTFVRRPTLLSSAVALVGLAGLVLTKESAAVTFAPFLGLAVIPLCRKVTRSGRTYALLAAGLLVLIVVGLGLLLVFAPRVLASNPLLQKTFGAGPLILSSVREAIPRVPTYSTQLTQAISPVDLGTGFLWATVLGFLWLVAQAAVALVTAQPKVTVWLLGWVAAALVWVVGISVPARDLGLINQSDLWVLISAGGLLVVIGTVELHLRNARRTGWGLALLGFVVLAVLTERLIIVATPTVSRAAFDFRLFMPIVPLFAVLAGGGLWAAAGAPALLVPTRSGRAVFALIASLVVIAFWSPLLRERLSSAPLLGRTADRGADPNTPQGLRVETLVEAEDWLEANVLPSDLIITGIPRHLAWYADLGVDGMENLIDLNSQPRSEAQKRAYILERVGPRGAAYVIDFNVNWLDPGGDNARAWRQTFEVLASRPNLEPAYVKRDRFGNPVFYVIRNHGYAAAPR